MTLVSVYMVLTTTLHTATDSLCAFEDSLDNVPSGASEAVWTETHELPQQQLN